MANKRKKWFCRIKRKFIKICRMRNKILKDIINNYVSSVQFLMLNGEGINISGIVKECIVKRNDDTEVMVKGLRKNKYFTPLMFAVTKEDFDLVNKEIENCNIDRQDDKGYTALMYACRFNRRADIVKMLLERGADIYIVSNDGKRALDFANDNGNNEIILVLNERVSQIDCDFLSSMVNKFKKVRFSKRTLGML